jgi:hypothetical protein
MVCPDLNKRNNPPRQTFLELEHVVSAVIVGSAMGDVTVGANSGTVTGCITGIGNGKITGGRTTMGPVVRGTGKVGTLIGTGTVGSLTGTGTVGTLTGTGTLGTLNGAEIVGTLIGTETVGTVTGKGTGTVIGAGLGAVTNGIAVVN